MFEKFAVHKYACILKAVLLSWYRAGKRHQFGGLHKIIDKIIGVGDTKIPM